MPTMQRTMGIALVTLLFCLTVAWPGNAQVNSTPYGLSQDEILERLVVPASPMIAPIGPIPPDPSTLLNFALGQANTDCDPHGDWDLDGDGLRAGFELADGSDPCLYDTDHDLLSDGMEYAIGTRPENWDTDGDEMPDYWEHFRGLNPLSGGDKLADPDDDNHDADGDGIIDLFWRNIEEYRFHRPAHWDESQMGPWLLGTQPTDPDSDGDSVEDGAEVFNGYAPDNVYFAVEIRPEVEGILEDTVGEEARAATEPYCRVADPTTWMPYVRHMLLVGDKSWCLPERFVRGQTYLADLVADNSLFGDGDDDGLLFVDEWGAGSDPTNPDTDADGLCDGAGTVQCRLFHYAGERQHGASPTAGDTDSDGLADGYEALLWSLPQNYIAEPGVMPPYAAPESVDVDRDGAKGVVDQDGDGDGVSDGLELVLGTALGLIDTDLDTLPDGAEAWTLGTNAVLADTDGDGLGDAVEALTSFTDPLNGDTEGDGVLDGEEVLSHQGDPKWPDTDNDGLPDGWEAAKGTVLAAPDAELDVDGDGLPNSMEHIVDTHPRLTSTQGDGIPDGWKYKWDLLDVTPAHAVANLDRDADGLTELLEFTMGTQPLTADSDGDGLNDGDEILVYQTSALDYDTDDDGLWDGPELIRWLLLGPDQWRIPVSITCSASVGNSSVLCPTSALDPYAALRRAWPKDATPKVFLPFGVTIPAVPFPAMPNITNSGPVNLTARPTRMHIPDADFDGLSDRDEFVVTKTKPNDMWSNLDRRPGLVLPDSAWAIAQQLGILYSTADDRDGDGVTNAFETGAMHSNPNAVDTDCDGLGDGHEFRYYGWMTGELGMYPWLIADYDRDGIRDSSEINLLAMDPRFPFYTMPYTEDSDGDGLQDLHEGQLKAPEGLNGAGPCANLPVYLPLPSAGLNVSNEEWGAPIANMDYAIGVPESIDLRTIPEDALQDVCVQAFGNDQCSPPDPEDVQLCEAIPCPHMFTCWQKHTHSPGTPEEHDHDLQPSCDLVDCLDDTGASPNWPHPIYPWGVCPIETNDIEELLEKLICDACSETGSRTSSANLPPLALYLLQGPAILSNPVLKDTDFDGLQDLLEVQNLSNPVACDTDKDGLGDGLELGIPKHAVIDISQGQDGLENLGIDPSGADRTCTQFDADPSTQTDLLVADSDLDAGTLTTILCDGCEDANQNGRFDDQPKSGEGNPLNPDSDGDTLLDAAEASATPKMALTCLTTPDCDEDSIHDPDEYNWALDINEETQDSYANFYDSDSDGDDLVDRVDACSQVGFLPGMVISSFKSDTDDPDALVNVADPDCDDDGLTDGLDYLMCDVSDPNTDDDVHLDNTTRDIPDGADLNCVNKIGAALIRSVDFLRFQGEIDWGALDDAYAGEPYPYELVVLTGDRMETRDGFTNVLARLSTEPIKTVLGAGIQPPSGERQFSALASGVTSPIPLANQDLRTPAFADWRSIEDFRLTVFLVMMDSDVFWADHIRAGQVRDTGYPFESNEGSAEEDTLDDQAVMAFSVTASAADTLAVLHAFDGRASYDEWVENYCKDDLPGCESFQETEDPVRTMEHAEVKLHSGEQMNPINIQRVLQTSCLMDPTHDHCWGTQKTVPRELPSQ